MRVGLAAVIAVVFIGGSSVAGFAQCPCTVNCPAGDGGITAPPPPGGHKTPDLDGNGSVDLVDLALFAGAWPPGPYLFCADYDCNGLIDLVDLAIFAGHWLHVGPVPGYNAPGIDHYKLYETIGPSYTGPLRLRDQFWDINVITLQLTKFATPVSKNDEGICDEFAHQSWWEFFVPGPIRMIEAQDQFGTNDWMLGEARYLVLPALKNEGVGQPLPEFNHYLCYEAQGPTLGLEVLLVDQFDQTVVIVLEGKYFCNPCEKETPDGIVYPIVDPEAHMTVYFVENPVPYDIPVLVQDQFMEGNLILHENFYLAVPALKNHVFEPGSSEWNRIKALYK
jgi:hypothetical protein